MCCAQPDQSGPLGLLQVPETNPASKVLRPLLLSKQKKTELYGGSEQIPEALISVSAAGCGDLE